MSQDEQDAIIGRVIREHKAATIKLAALQSEAIRFGEQLNKIGNLLIREPNRVVRQGENFLTETVGSEAITVDPVAVNMERILTLTKEIRECLKEVNGLERQRGDLGV